MTIKKRLQKGKRLYKSFHEENPQRVDKLQIKTDDVLIKIGRCTHIGYLALDGKNYMHKFRNKSAPMLAASHDGKRLYLIQGKFRFTDRGIVDT